MTAEVLVPLLIMFAILIMVCVGAYSIFKLLVVALVAKAQADLLQRRLSDADNQFVRDQLALAESYLDRFDIEN